MLYSEEFLRQFKLDPIASTKAAIAEAHEGIDLEASSDTGWTQDEFDRLLELLALVVEAEDAGMYPFKLERPDLNSNIQHDCSNIYRFTNELLGECDAELSRTRLKTLRKRFRANLGVAFGYEFSQGDLDRVQVLLNELRVQIAQAEGLEDEHRQRLLARLEKLQGELHKRVSDLDRFWGLLGDAGVALEKLGNNAKPIVDRIREVTQIVWQTQSRAEELPSGSPFPQIENKPSPHPDDTV